jgi:hypothetical protein
MAETMGQMQTYIQEVLPSGINSTTIVTFINQELRMHWEDLTSTNYYEFDTVTDQAIYALPSDMEFEMIAENGVLIANTTATVSSTTVFEDYEYCGPEDELIGSRFYDAIGSIGIYPVPNNGYPARIRYQERPTLFASTDTSVQFNIDQDYVDLIRYRVMAMVARSGNAPDVDLANNYMVSAMEVERRIKMRNAKKRAKISQSRISYQEGWDD